MPYYETVFIARPELAQKQVEDLTESFCKIIKGDKGKIHKTEYWGLRTLAYRINKNRKGHYVLIETDTPPAALHEMERQMRLNEDVIRFLTVKNEALSKGQSPIMDKGGRDYEESSEQQEAA